MRYKHPALALADHNLYSISLFGTRIEIEGGFEIPILDGSALGWAVEVQLSGLRVAPLPDGTPEPVRRVAMRPREVSSEY